MAIFELPVRTFVADFPQHLQIDVRACPNFENAENYYVVVSAEKNTYWLRWDLGESPVIRSHMISTEEPASPFERKFKETLKALKLKITESKLSDEIARNETCIQPRRVSQAA